MSRLVGDMADPKRDYWVTVCAHCLTASCWHGSFLCQKFETAGVVEKKASELDLLNKEHPSHYSVSRLTKVCGRVRYVDDGSVTAYWKKG